MKKILLIAIFVISIHIPYLNAQTPGLSWAKSIGSPGEDAGQSIAVDDSGNVYTTGYFIGTADFDPGPGIFNLTSNGATDIFIEKMNAAGNFIWAKSIGGTGDDYAYALALDHSGNIFTTGSYNAMVDFDPGAGVYNLNSNGSRDIFIEKLDANGNMVWAKTVGGLGNDDGYAVALDPAGNVCITGSFANTVDFDPGIGSYLMTEANGGSVYILKLHSAGNFLFAKSFTGAGGGWGVSVSCDGLGNIYTTGTYGGTLDFDPGPGTFNLTSYLNSFGMGGDIFIQMSDMNGNFVWANSKGNVNNTDAAYSIVADSTGNIYNSGYLTDTIDFDPGPGVFNLISNGLEDIFIQKLDASGNLLWAKSFGGIYREDVNNMALDATGNIYIPGNFGDTVDFDPGPGTHFLFSTGNTDIYILKLNPLGDFVWAIGIGGTSAQSIGDGWSVATNTAGDVYATGYFSGTCDFDPGTNVYNLAAVGNLDIFILKLSQGFSGIDQYERETKLEVFPNPTTGSFTINTGSDFSINKVEITTVTGQVVDRKMLSDTHALQMNLAGPDGLYFVKVTGTNGKQVSIKVAKQ